METILSIQQAIILSQQQRQEGKKIVLAGGCFDMLHIGHITFLKNARKKGDALFVMIESDESVKMRKGIDRPIHTQSQRAELVAALRFVDAAICIPFFSTHEE